MKLNPALVLERVGDDVIALDSQKSLVLTFSGQHARVLGHVLDGTDVSEDEQAVQDLLSQGVLVESKTASLTRRTMLVSGSAIAASGALVFALPATANASSPGGLAAPIFAPQPVPGALWSAPTGTNNYILTYVFPPVSSLSNKDDYDFSQVSLEWSFSSDSEGWFELEIDEGGRFGIEVFLWDYDLGDDEQVIPLGNLVGVGDDQTLLLWIRARAGDLVSSPSQVSFEKVDG